MVHEWEIYKGRISMEFRIVVVKEVGRWGRKEWDWEKHTAGFNYFLKS